MVVILIVKDLSGPRRPKKRVTYVSSIFIKPSLFAQVEPGDTFATTKEGEFLQFHILTIKKLTKKLFTTEFH